jgi:hypothetical protein
MAGHRAKVSFAAARRNSALSASSIEEIVDILRKVCREGVAQVELCDVQRRRSL